MSNRWTERHICDVCLVTDYVANGSFAALRENVKYMDGDGYAILVRLADSTRGWNGNYKYVSDAAYRFLKKTALKPGDLVMSNVGEPGKVFVVPDLRKPMTLGPNAVLIRCNAEDCLNQFLYYYFSSDAGRSQIDDISEGVAQKKFNKTAFRALKLPIPSLREQQRIVGTLDESFAAIAGAKANAEQNLQNARALFESRLNEVLMTRGNGWTDFKLGDACDITRGGSPRPIKHYITTQPDGINWIKIGDATASGKYIYETEEKIKPEGAKRSRIVNDGDFILSNSMSFGRPYIMRTTGCVHDGWLVLSNYESRFQQDYLYYVLGSQFVFRQFDRLAAGSTVRNLNIELASRVVIPAPPLEQQGSLAAQLESLSAEVEKLAVFWHRKVIALEALKNSLLHQAFIGQL